MEVVKEEAEERGAISSFERGLTSVARVFQIIGIFVIVLMVGLTVADVVGRRFFNQSLTGAHELQQFSLMAAAFFTVGLCTLRREHVEVTIMSDMLPKKLMGWIEVVTSFIALGMFILMLWRAEVKSMMLRTSGTLTAELRQPEWPYLAFIAGFGLLLLILAQAVVFVNNVRQAVKK